MLGAYTRFSIHSVVGSEGLTDRVRAGGEVEAAAYWTAVAPNVEEYGGAVAKAIASGAESLAKGILWCGRSLQAAQRLGRISIVVSGRRPQYCCGSFHGQSTMALFVVRYGARSSFLPSLFIFFSGSIKKEEQSLV
jgi:hypothetical protein